MLQMDGVSALDCQFVCTIAEHQTGNNMHECKCIDTTGSIELESQRKCTI